MFVNQLHTLLAQELARQRIRPFAPIALGSRFVDEPQLHYPILVRIAVLAAFFLDKCAEWVVRIIGFGFLQHILTWRFVGIKYHVYAVRHVVAVEGHSLHVLVSVHQNTHLCIVAVAQIQIIYASANLDGAIFLDARVPVRRNIIPITNHQTVGIH